MSRKQADDGEAVPTVVVRMVALICASLVGFGSLGPSISTLSRAREFEKYLNTGSDE